MGRTSKITDMSVYKRYLKDRGIKYVKNNIDIILKKRRVIEPGDYIGFIEYEDGTFKKLYSIDKKYRRIGEAND